MILNDMILLFAEPFEGPFVFSFPSILIPNQNHRQVGFLKPDNYLQVYLILKAKMSWPSYYNASPLNEIFIGYFMDTYSL